MYIKQRQEAISLIRSLQTINKSLIYYDLTDNYIKPSSNDDHYLLGNHIQGYKIPIAKTRTLNAYCVSSELASILLRSMNSFSLPIDMKIQIALIQNSIPGIYLKSSPFEHASKLENSI